MVVGVVDLAARADHQPSRTAVGRARGLDRVFAVVAARLRRQTAFAIAEYAVVLAVRDLCGGPRLARASLTVAAGEILGVAGLIGAGRTELVRALFGLDRCAGGVVTLAGREVTGQGPRAGWRFSTWPTPGKTTEVSRTR